MQQPGGEFLRSEARADLPGRPGGELDEFRQVVFAWLADRAPLRALIITLVASLLVAVISAVMGTIIAWVLVRDEFPGKAVINTLIDLPFAMPTA